MSTITLSCLVAGENPYENAFEVDIEENRSISKLKDAIKEKLHPKFENVTANDIKLWKVDISLEKENEKLIAVNKKINVDIKEELDGEELPPLSKISKHFSSQPADEHIHIIVQRPTEAKEVHVAATYNRKKKTFQWTVTREMVSLAELKKLLREHFEFPDGTEDEHIVIGRVISGVKRKTSKGKSKKSASKLQSETMEDVTVDVEDAESATGRKVVSFSKDGDLVSIVWTNNRVIDLNIAVDTSQQPFSSYSFSKMKALFGLKYDDYDDLPEYVLFHESYLDSAVPEDVLNHVIEDILKKHTASRPIRADVNGATRREFISSVIYGVASTFKGTIKIYPEYQVSGTHGKGPIDWIIKIGDIIICVTEAKSNDISWGVGQSTVQAHASMQLNNNKKHTYDDADLDVEEVFCIVSTGTEWVMTKVVQKRDNYGNVEVFMCTPMPEPIPINQLSLTRDTLYRPVKHLLSIINNFVMMMKDSVDNRDKRVKLTE